MRIATVRGLNPGHLERPIRQPRPIDRRDVFNPQEIRKPGLTYGEVKRPPASTRADRRSS
jgi:hypothetical protein